MPSSSNRKIVNIVEVDGMPSVKVRTRTANTQILKITYKTRTRTGVRHVVIGDLRDVVDGVRICVVKIELQSVRDSLAQRDLQGIVVRAGIVPDVAVGGSLRGQPDVEVQQTERRDSLDRIREVALNDQLAEHPADDLRAIQGNSEEEAREALTIGSAAHLILKPRLRRKGKQA